jgi:hypothetical protein
MAVGKLSVVAVAGDSHGGGCQIRCDDGEGPACR